VASCVVLARELAQRGNRMPGLPRYLRDPAIAADLAYGPSLPQGRHGVPRVFRAPANLVVRDPLAEQGGPATAGRIEAFLGVAG